MSSTIVRPERAVRERLLRQGPGRLTDTELLAMLLAQASRSQNRLALAQNLLSHFGSLGRLVRAAPSELGAIAGVGDAGAAGLLAAGELASRALEQELEQRPALQSPADCRPLLVSRMRHLPNEHFAAIFLDNRHRVLRFEILFQGTIDTSAVYPRVVVGRCLVLNAAAVIFAHNHPSGICEPSEADRQITRRLQQALELIDVRVLDHFIVGDGTPWSMAEQGGLYSC